ncbi:MAG: ATP-binding protein [Cyclobacterium sp.]|uniref:sensor histidine kinase n=1 Tax=unclassified Cyclobacterium TaxID=2615055 RepID=UPI0013D12B1F|nr:ATP-binding protein [Cyclobacterium sp. SYSU L10401]
MTVWKRFKEFTPLQWGWTVFLSLSLLALLLSKRIYTMEKANETMLVREEASKVQNLLSISLANSVSSTELLAYMVEKGLTESDFESLSRKILSQNATLDALQLVEAETIIKTFPLEGNESVIGYNIFEDINHLQAADSAIARKKLYFEGPFELRQGGLGLVGRLPVFKDGLFWGFTAVIIRMETLKSSLQIDDKGMSENYIYQLAKLDGFDAYPLFDFEKDPDFETGIVHKAFFEEGDWYLYVKLRHPTYFRNTLIFLVFGLVFAGMVGLFVYQKTTEPIKLKMLVEEKSKEQHELNQALEKKAHDLSRSNEELEQFAYVASHDLQEPLRMISSFIALLGRKYGERLDEKGMQYIHFAVDGASRMRQIILDLLTYSRVGKNLEENPRIQVAFLLDEVLHLYRKQIREKKAVVHYKDLPEVWVDKYLLGQLFQNLIGNALKYSKKDESPLIKIKLDSQGNEWLFSIEDNGIGIDKAYHEKIFLMFNRLHSFESYEGTGIGLAVVKKTVEHFGGRIWLDSEMGVGTTFYFTLPK